MKRCFERALFVSLMLAAGCAAGRAAHREFAIVTPDGRGLPPGSGTATRGSSIFATRCAQCHSLYSTPRRIALIAGAGSLGGSSPQRTVASYWPYAPPLFSYIQRAMPLDAPGTLSNDEVYALCAYILASAGLVPPKTAVNRSILAHTRMPNRNGFELQR
jgi:hypothetical protein